MALFQWSDTFSVGISSIDRQHQKLISLVNELHEAMKNGKSKEVLGYIIEELINYTKYHFQTEEELFHKYQYPQEAAHKAAHDSFVEKVLQFQEGFESGKVLLSMEILQFLKQWVSDHIQKVDKQYSFFLKEKGVK
ncbi:MAG: hemerythrin [Calditrichaeota bacterium]|nr:MAG: hemerythrin [Calditrichota bacterium]